MTYLEMPNLNALYRMLKEECFSAEQFTRYCTELSLPDPSVRGLGMVSFTNMFQLIGGKSPGGFHLDNILYRAFETLMDADVFTRAYFGAGQKYDLKINFDRVMLFSALDCLDNIIKGNVFVVEKYSSSAVAIIVKKKGDEFAGTGCLVSNGRNDFILTNSHVVDPAMGFNVDRILLGGVDSSELLIDREFILSNTDDLAVLPLSFGAVPTTIPRLRIGFEDPILQRVTTLAFPKIPNTKRFFLTAHSGEINARIITRTNEPLILVSSYAAPGSSGGPVVDKKGLLVGVISERIESTYEDGNFYHSAAVPLDRVVEFMRRFTGT